MFMHQTQEAMSSPTQMPPGKPAYKFVVGWHIANMMLVAGLFGNI